MSARSFSSLLYVFLVSCSANTDAQENWPGFRGDGSGIANRTSLPIRWSPDNNIAWKFPLVGYGQSSPVIWENTVYVTSTNGPFQEECIIQAIELTDGTERWSKTIRATTKVENYFRNSRAAPTCVADKSGVYSFFASGDVTALTHAGEVRWTVPLVKTYGEVDNERGIASSLAQDEDLVFVVIDHHGPSYITAINKLDGTIAWKSDRGKRLPSWSSPVVANLEGQSIVVISSSDTVDAYDATSGRALWQLDGLQGNHIPSATVVGDRVFVGSTTMYGGATNPDEVAGSNCCIELSREGENPTYKVLWSAEKANSYYSSPLAVAGYVYYVNKVGVLYCVDQETGKQVYAKRIGNPCWASAISATAENGEPLIYFVLKNGSTIVLRPGDQYDQLARNRLWDASEMADAAASAAAMRKNNRVPADQAKPKSGPEKVFAGLPERQLHQMFSYGDPTVYGAAASGTSLVIRTGQQLFCVRNPN